MGLENHTWHLPELRSKITSDTSDINNRQTEQDKGEDA